MDVKLMYHESEFTEQTATLLRGLGASDLIPECKKRGVSTSALHKLTWDDFIILGADADQADNLIVNLKSNQRDKTYKLQQKVPTFLNIIENTKQHLSILNAYMIYCRLRLQKEKNNYYYDADKNVTMSTIFYTAADATVAQIQDLQETLNELQDIFNVSKVQSKPKLSYLNSCILFGGLSLMFCIVFRVYRGNKFNFFNSTL